MAKLKLLILGFIFLTGVSIRAQNASDNYQIRVTPNRDDWTYELNQTAKFFVVVTLNNQSAAGLPIKYSCGPEAMPPRLEKNVTTAKQILTIDAGSLSEPGFLRCIVTMEANGKTYRGLATAGFRPDLIKPTITDPQDFDAFWANGKTELAKLAMDAKMQPLPNLSNDKADVYQVSFQNVGRVSNVPSRIYGILAIPKTDNPNKKFPAVLHVPGAGVRPYRGSLALAERGIITLQIGIHGIPVNLEQSVYDDLAAGALKRYMYEDSDDKNFYYYRRVFLGCLRANDFLTSLPQYDGKNLAVMGGSQGGALSVMTAVLDSRVKGLAVWIPALADLTGYLYNRAGGWHHAFKEEKNRTSAKIETSKYYDTVNFARRLKVPGIYAFGYNDETCPPTSMFAAYNTISAPKNLVLSPPTGHALTNDQSAKINDWLEALLKKEIVK